MAGRKKVALLPGSRRDVVLQQQSQNKPLGLVINNQSSKNHSLPRPKRNIQVKNLDDSSGLSWREERELKRALYASLQESRRQSRPQQQEESEDEQKNSTPPSGTNKIKTKTKTTPATNHTTSSSSFTTTTTTTTSNSTTTTTTTPVIATTPTKNISADPYRRNSLHLNNHNHLKYRSNHCHTNNTTTNYKASTNSRGRVPILTASSFNHISSSSSSSSSNQSTCSNNSSASTATNSVVDENSRDSMKPVLGVGAHIRSANLATTDIKRTKIHAQRKFAQGSLPTTPNTTPNKAKMSPLCLPKRAKTEDFLTFLCLRGSSVLPSHLDFFNYSSKDSASGGENSRPQTPASNYKQQHNSSRAQTRESSPLSTATSTSSNDDVGDVLPSFHEIQISAYTNGVGVRRPKPKKPLKVTKSKSREVQLINSPGVKKSKAVRCLQTPNRHSARASASTPETARGLAGVQQSLVKKVAGKLGAKLGLTNSSRLRSTPNGSPNKKTVKAKIPHPKTAVRNGLHANDLRNKKRSPGRPPLKRKLKERGTRLKSAPVHIIPETKKRTVVVRSGKPGVLRTLTKSQNSNYTTSAQSQKAYSKTNAHSKPIRNAAHLSHRNHSNSVLPVVPLRKLSENLPNRQKVPQRGNSKLPSRPVRKVQKKVWKHNKSTDGPMLPTPQQFSKKRSRREVNAASKSRPQKGRLGANSHSDPEPRIQPSRFSKRLSLQVAQKEAVEEEVENKIKPPAPKKAKLSEPLAAAAPVSTAPVLQPVSSTAPSLPHLFSSPSPSMMVTTTQASSHSVNSTVCQNGMHHHHPHHHHHFHHVHQRPQQQQQQHHHHHHHHHHPSTPSHIHHHQHQQQYHHHHQQQLKQKQQQLVTKQQLIKQQSTKQETTKQPKQNKQQTNKVPKQPQQQSTPKPQKQHQTPTSTKQQMKQQHQQNQQQEQVQTNNMSPAMVETSDVSSKKKSNSLKVTPTREQLKLARIIEKRRGKKNSSLPSATADTPNNLSQVVNESAKPKENVPTTERRRGRPPISKKSPPSPSVDCEPKAKPFPADGDPAGIVDIPIFYPSEEQFQDPLAYIESIKKEAEPYGMCKIVPPSSWKHESRINEEMRFTCQVQYINRMFNRWGPNVQHVECIQKHLASVGIELNQPPLVGGVELDLSRLHQSIKEQGGMQTVMDKKKWGKVADMVKIPKQAQDRTTKLYNAYCKYLLSYELLPEVEKAKLLQQVTEERNQRIQQRQNKVCHLNEDDGTNRCIAKGKSTSVNAFQRVARNIQSMWFREDPTPEQVESEYWKIVQEASAHVAVQCAHINSGNQSTFLPNKKENPSAKHGWNFNMLSQNPLSVLRHLGPVPGVTLPILHIGMLFTTSCWSVNRHNLPYVHYLHSGADLIWYSIPKQLKLKLKSAMKQLVPSRIGNGEAWLKEDAVMLNPEMLVEKGVSVGRIVQKQHQFVVVFPYTYTSSLTCGYSVSECLPYATPDWLPLGQAIAQVLRRNCLWPEMFSLDSLLRRIVKAEPAVSDELLTQALPFLEKAIEHELSLRKQLYEAGLKNAKKMNANEPLVPSSPKRKRSSDGEEENRCEVYKRICYFSMVVNEVDDSLYCLDHALDHIQKKRNLKACRLYYRYSDEDLQDLLKNASSRLDSKVTAAAITDPSPKRKSMKVNETSGLKKLNVD